VHSTLRIAACAALAFPCIASAVEPLNMKAGLWEVTQTMTTSGAPLYIEAMPPAQRSIYAEAWKKDVGKPQTDVEKECLTAEDIKSAKVFQDESAEGKQCKQTVTKQSPTAWIASSECKDAKTTNLIQLDYAAPSPDKFTGVVKSTTTSPNGKTIIEIKLAGKWIGASCPAEDEEESDDAEE
jgi:hypothetical protein